MAEPQPAGIEEGIQVPSATPSSSAEQKSAAAPQLLDTNGHDDTSGKQTDAEALGKAMKDLNIHSSSGSAAQGAAVKIDPSEVALLAQQLDLTKVKATDLLKAHNSNITEAIAAWIAAI